MEECEEICCICDVTFQNDVEYSSHLENEVHLLKLVETRFISLKFANIFKHLLARYNDGGCSCSTDSVDFETYVGHLKCSSEKPKPSLFKCASTMTEPHFSPVSSMPSVTSPPGAETSGSTVEPSHSSTIGAANSESVERNGTELPRPKHQKLLVKQFYKNRMNKFSSSVSTFNGIINLSSGSENRKPPLTSKNFRLSTRDKTESKNCVPEKKVELPNSMEQTENCLQQRNENTSGLEDAQNFSCNSDSVSSPPLTRGKTLSDCSFNRPVLSSHQTEDSYAFYIYQCSTCKALIYTSNVESHFSSVRHLKSVVCIGVPEKGSKKIEVNCLACNVLIKGASQLVRHRESEDHRIALVSMSENPRKEILDNLELLKKEVKTNLDLQPQLQSLRSSAFIFTLKFNRLFHLYKLIAIFHKDSNSICDFFPDEKLKLIPELNFYLEHANKNLIPETFAVFKGIFMCSICGLLFGNLFTLASHVLVELNHVMKSSFKSPSISCLLCEKIHNIASLNLLLQTHRKIDLSTGAKSQCILAGEIPPESTMIEVSKHLESTSSLDLKEFTGSYRCNSSFSFLLLHAFQSSRSP